MSSLQFIFKKTSFFLSLLIIYSTIVFAEQQTLRILHWNDFHSQNVPMKVVAKDSITGKESTYLVGGTAALLGYINKEKENRNDVIVLNAGDDFQGTPISSLTFGQSQIELMNIIHPDAVTLGNHEFDYGVEHLSTDIALAQYPIVCSNVYVKSMNQPLGDATKIITIGKLKIGLIGFTPPDLEILTVKKNIEGLELKKINDIADSCIKELKSQKVNLIIMLSHMGLDKDSVFADHHKDVDIIVGGHTHTALFSPIKKNHTIIVQAGSKGQYLGELDLVIDTKIDSILSFKGKLIETKVEDIVADEVAEKKVDEFEDRVNKELNEVIGTLEKSWKREFGKKESNIGDWECDVVREKCNTDIAFVNGAGIRKDLNAGPITLRDMWEINPFNNTLVTFSVSGKMLRTMMEVQAGISARDFMQISGITFEFDESQSAGEKVTELLFNGIDVDDKKTYSIATNNYIANHLKDFFGIDDPSILLNDTGIVDRETFIEKIRSVKTISSSKDGRIISK